VTKKLEEYPELMTVEEAAEYLRVSRALGYQLARQYRISGGTAGLPVLELGRCLRVPRSRLAELVGVDLDAGRGEPQDIQDAQAGENPSADSVRHGVIRRLPNHRAHGSG
jgi:excisionase family DNA binding protein